jgi:hypothetical protein
LFQFPYYFDSYFKFAYTALRNSRKTDSLPAVKSAEFLFRLVPPKAAFAVLTNTRKTDSLRRLGLGVFLSNLVPRLRGLCAFEENETP